MPSERFAWWACLIGECLLLAAPLWFVEIPPLLDYPNHLARMHVLASAGDPVLARIYAQDWRLIPNLAIDVLMPPMLAVMPLYAAGRLVLAASLLAPPLGVVVLHRAWFGARSWWPLAAGLLAWNTLFLMGFINFQLGMGAALAAAAGWVRWRERAPGWVAVGGVLVGLALFFVHLFALAFAGLLIGAQEVVAIRRSGIRAVPPRLAFLCLPFVLPALMLLRSPVIESAGRTIRFAPLVKLWLFLSPFLSEEVRLDLLAAILVIGVAIACAWRRRVAAPAAIAGLVLLVGFAIAPFSWRGTGHLDVRLIVCAALLLFAGCDPRPAGAARALGVIVAVLLVLRTGSVVLAWRDADRDIADLRVVTAGLAPGERVLAVDAADARLDLLREAHPSRVTASLFPTYFQLPALMLIERHAFWPLLFARAGKQPVEVLPPYRAIARADGRPAPLVALSREPLTDEDLEDAPYLAGWQCNFDDVLVLNAEEAGDLGQFLPDRLELVGQRGFAALLRIKKR